MWRFVDSNMMEFPNQEGLNKAFNIYRAAMRKFIISRLKQIPGTNVESVVIDSLEYRRVDEVKRVLAHSDRNIESAIDINDFPHLVHKNWREAFEVQLNDDKTFRNQLWLIVECRNADWAHPPEGDAESEGTRAHLFLIADVLGKISESDAKRVREIRDQLFFDEAEEHPAEVENIAYKERLADMTKQLEAAKAEKTELEKQVKTTSDRLEEVDAEWIASEKRLETRSFGLKMAVAGKTVAEERLSDTLNRLEEAEVEKAELKKRLKTTSDQLEAANAEKTKYEKALKAASNQLATLKAVKAELEDRLEMESTQLEDTKAELIVWKERHTRVLKQLKVVEAEKNELKERLPEIPEHLPPGKEMVQPALEFLSDRGECPRVEIINVLTDHFSLTKNQREKLSRSGKAEVYLRNKGLIERTRTGYYQITDRGFETLHQSGTDGNSVFSNEMHAESQIHPKNTVKSQKSQRKWRRPGAVAALCDPAEIREAEAKIAKILNPSEKARLERELRKAKRSVDSS